MIVAGCDVGSLTAKALLMDQGRIIAAEVMPVRARPEQSADEIMQRTLTHAGLTFDDIACCVGTGYGRAQIPFIDAVISELSCHSRGAQWLLPSVRTIIDIGGQDCKVIKVDGTGRILKFNTNDKCAAGTGRFLEVMSRLLEVSLEDLGRLAARSRSPLSLTSTCNVWAQSEVIYHLNDERPREDIVAGINQAMAERVTVLVNRLGIERDVCMTGGVAKNRGVVANLEKLLGVRIKRFRIDPQLMGAVGAAVFAAEQLSGGERHDNYRRM